MSMLCLYAPHGPLNCMDLGCMRRGGHCEVAELDDKRFVCNCAASRPSTNLIDVQRGRAMDQDDVDIVALYRSKLAEIEPCSDSWFEETLHAAQAGDDNACRRIVGSC